MIQVVYVSSQESQEIHVWKLDNLGKLALLQILDVPGLVQPMVIHPNKTNLYVGIRKLFGIISYLIKEDGTLRQVGKASLPGNPSYISTDKRGQYLFAASYTGNCISVSQIQHDGVVTEPIQYINELITPHSANIDIGNQRLLVPCLKEDLIRLFSFNVNGQLTPYMQKSVNTTTNSGPRHIAFHPNGKYAYCIKELDGTVDVLAILENGSQYHIIQTIDIMPISFSGMPWAADIHITPNSQFLYTSERSASMLSIFKIAEDGSKLSVIGHHPSQVQPRSFNIDHSGHFIISACQQSGNIAVHKINQSNGKLRTLAIYPVGKNPVWVSILAS